MKKIRENNKYLARFMGYEIDGDTVICYSGQRLHISEFHYERDWGELMPVVEKINKRDWVTIKADECKIHSLMVNEFDDILVIDENCDMKTAIYEAVSQYAKWFIDNKKSMIK